MAFSLSRRGLVTGAAALAAYGSLTAAEAASGLPPYSPPQRQSRNAGCYRIFGSGIFATGATSLSTCYLKIELEAPFTDIQLVIPSVTAPASSNWTACVAVTETSDQSTQTTQYTPIVGGTSYNSLNSVTNPYGWRTVTWGGAPSGTIPAGSLARPSYLISDRIPLNSIVRTDGIGRPYVLIRVCHDGTTGQHALVSSNGTTPLGIPTGYLGWNNSATQAQPWYRKHLTAATGTNGVATLTNMPSTNYSPTDTNWIIPVGIIATHTVPTRAVAAVGDSITEGGGGQNYGLNAWIVQACYGISTPQAPVTPFNLGASGQNSATYLQILTDHINLGVPLTDVFIAAGTPNDGGPSIYSQDIRRANMRTTLRMLNAIGARPFLWPAVPNNGYASNGVNAADDYRKLDNAALQAFCASTYGVNFVNFNSVVSTLASPERWITRAQYGTPDGTHPGQTDINAIVPVVTAALQGVTP